ncbi:U-box domain-containing protein [Musa troglodytarum]|uniref:U-box domain-containing protein n=2 Tax=Musa troglodytarum TaxID=320322 RepID=A0A9E7HJY3_9LILI|nr:U-box domain-containing protein [Musa troglodytarum]
MSAFDEGTLFLINEVEAMRSQSSCHGMRPVLIRPAEENNGCGRGRGILFVAGDAKVHGRMFRVLHVVVCKVLEIFPLIEAARPRSKSGIQALCSLHVALEKAKCLLQHCSECSKLYLIIAIVGGLEETVFELDQSEKQAGEKVISLLQKEGRFKNNLNDSEELELFHQAASRLGIASSRAALMERRALKKLIERARAQDDKRKESIVSYLYHLMRKYSKLFRNEHADDTDSQGSTPRSPTIQGFEDDSGPCKNNHTCERQLTKPHSFNFKQNGRNSGNMPVPPEEFICPISLQLMFDPVIVSSGQTSNASASRNGLMMAIVPVRKPSSSYPICA